jgi:hypothetical protein
MKSSVVAKRKQNANQLIIGTHIASPVNTHSLTDGSVSHGRHE